MNDYYIDNNDYFPDAADQFANDTFNNNELPDYVQDITDAAKVEDEDNAQMQHSRFKKAKRVEQRQSTTQQYQSDNLYDFSTTDLHNIINIGRDARNIIITRIQANA